MDTGFFIRDAVGGAAHLIGMRLLVNGVGGIIAETETYRQDDETSHSHRGRIVANAAMFGTPASAYVYRSYGLHWCLNFVCEPGSALLIRALEPTHGLTVIAERRKGLIVRKLSAGPGNLCKALGVHGGMNGLSALLPPFALELPAQVCVPRSGVRIGVSKAADRPWRFAMEGSAYLSKPIC